MFSSAFWKDAGERAVKTAAQALLALWLVGDKAFDVLHADFGQAAGIAAGAAVVSILTSIVSTSVSGQSGTASLVDSVSYEDESAL